MSITGVGNVGINTNNFNEKFNLGCGAAIGFQNTCNCQKWHIQYNSNDGLNFVESTIADFRLFLKAGGRIGMGTSTPGSRLHLYGTESELGIQVAKNGSDTVGQGPYITLQNLANTRQWLTQLTADNHLASYYFGGGGYIERYRFNTGGAFTVPGQPAMLAQPGASSFVVGGYSSTAYGWCVSGGIRFNNGFTFSGATSAVCNVADAGNSGKIIIPADGRYILQFSQRNEGQTGSDGQFYLWVNGTQRIRRHIELWNGKPYIHVDVTAVLSLSANDTLEMGAWFNTVGCTNNFSGTSDQVNWMSLAKIS
jgi:hypothetical protein